MNDRLWIENGYANLPFIEELYAKYRENPSSIDDSWQKFFTEFDNSKSQYSFAPSSPVLPPEETKGRSVVYYPKVEISSPGDLRVYNLIEAYRTYGHLL